MYSFIVLAFPHIVISGDDQLYDAAIDEAGIGIC